MKPLPAHEVMLTPDQAQAAILRHTAPLGTEVVDLAAVAAGPTPRVLATALVSARTLPPWDNSAMDGYAVRAAEVVAGGPLPVHGVIAAGHPATDPLPVGGTLRIMTGAPIPPGADAVIMREEADEQDGQVRFRVAARPRQHIRPAGEDIRAGDQILAAGATLGAGEVGVLAALGRSFIDVYRRPQVAVLATGDELVPPDCPPGPGQITNSNSHALAAQIWEAGGVARILPIVPDRPDAMRAAFLHALQADVVVSSGGVSVGQFDYVRDVLRDLGAHEIFSRVAMKPGKPLTFSTIDLDGAGGGATRRVLWFGLPGNPASSMVSFELFVRPALRRMGGFPEDAVQRPRAWVQLAAAVDPDRTRLHFTRAQVRRQTTPQADDALLATPLSWQGSGMLRSMIGLNALLHIPPGPAPLPVGTRVLATLLAAI